MNYDKNIRVKLTLDKNKNLLMKEDPELGKFTLEQGMEVSRLFNVIPVFLKNQKRSDGNGKREFSGGGQKQGN